MEKDFNVGDIVYLKSEDKIDASKRNYMTITNILEYQLWSNFDMVGPLGTGEVGINCAWFKDNELKITIFNKKLLIIAGK